jgi:hypothetical protein
MTKLVALLVVATACGGSTLPPPPPARTAEDAPTLDALRAAKFDEAVRLASGQLKIAPRDSEAAAIRALATYAIDSTQMLAALNLRNSWFPELNALDPKAAPAIDTFLGQLDAIDRDLAIAADDATFSLELCIACWQYDWNQDGKIDERDTGFLELDGFPVNDPRRRPTFHFDIGDVSWARAMVAFQRAAGELILSYRWSDENVKGDREDKQPIVIHLIAPERVKRARALILAGLEFSDTSRKQYLAETDDDREWVPNPNQKSHPIPLDVDAKLYDTWAGVVGDVRNLVVGRQGISLKEVAVAIDPRDLLSITPDAYIDVGRMLSEPTDITIFEGESGKDAASIAKLLHGVLGHGYAEHMTASPLAHRLMAMKNELAKGGDTLEHKLHYLFWIN